MSVEDLLARLNINDSLETTLTPNFDDLSPILENPLDNDTDMPQTQVVSQIAKFDTKELNIVPDFDGNPNELYNFLKSATVLLNQYWDTTNTACFQNHVLYLGLINKLRGRAKELVSIYGCTDWDSAKEVLITNFADQRNENSLTRDLVNLHQNPNEDPYHFHERVMSILNTISNYIELHVADEGIKASKKLFFQQQALTTFLAGLKEPLGATIRAMRPSNLASAIQYIQEENNIRYLQKTFTLPQSPFSQTNILTNRRMQHPSTSFSSPQWQPSGPKPQQWSQQFTSPQQPAFRPPQQPTFRPPQPPLFRNQPQQSFPTPRPFIQPARFQTSHAPPRSNVWAPKPGPSPHLPRPTPMSVTSRVPSQIKPSNFRPPQPSRPKFVAEELFNIEQDDQWNYNGEPYNYYYEDYPYQEEDPNTYETTDYQETPREDQNFQEVGNTNEET